jgi:hypothetical protein
MHIDDIKLIALQHAVTLGAAAVTQMDVSAAQLVAMATKFEAYLKGGDQK